MRALVYLKTSDTSSALPDHHCSQELASKILEAKYARPIGRNTIQLLVEESWQWVKAQARAMVNAVAPKPKRSMAYEHHIEPKLEIFTAASTDWTKYMHGYPYELQA